MAVAGATMPALLVVRSPRTKLVSIQHRENRPTAILTHDPEEAETMLLSTGKVWIPATLRATLAERMRTEIRAGI